MQHCKFQRNQKQCSTRMTRQGVESQFIHITVNVLTGVDAVE